MAKKTRNIHELGRNDPCPCGSGKKYKHCCLDKAEANEHEQLEIAANALRNHAGEYPGRASTANMALERANRWRTPKE